VALGGTREPLRNASGGGLGASYFSPEGKRDARGPERAYRPFSRLVYLRVYIVPSGTCANGKRALCEARFPDQPCQGGSIL
jgi:hypothetical protein